MGYSRSAVAKVEVGPYNATLAFLEAFAEAVGAPSIPALFTKPDGDLSGADELFGYFRAIENEQHRSTVIQVAKQFANQA